MIDIATIVAAAKSTAHIGTSIPLDAWKVYGAEAKYALANPSDWNISDATGYAPGVLRGLASKILAIVHLTHVKSGNPCSVIVLRDGKVYVG